MTDPTLLIHQMRMCADCAAASPNGNTYLNEAARPMLRQAADEIERLQVAKRAALAIADERSKENVVLRAIARDARDHVPADILARIDAVLRGEQSTDGEAK